MSNRKSVENRRPTDRKRTASAKAETQRRRAVRALKSGSQVSR